MQIVINPKARIKAKRWLAENFLTLLFHIENKNEMTVNAEQVLRKKTHNEELKVRMSPVLGKKEGLKTKKDEKKMKTCVQALKLN